MMFLAKAKEVIKLWLEEGPPSCAKCGREARIKLVKESGPFRRIEIREEADLRGWLEISGEGSKRLECPECRS